MRKLFANRYLLLFLLGCLFLFTASQALLFTQGKSFFSHTDTTLPQEQVSTNTMGTATPLAALTPTPPSVACQKQIFQTGIAFPQWYSGGYGPDDTKWLTGVQDIQRQTGACWIEMPVLLYQDSLSTTSVTTGPSTPQLSAFRYGIHYAVAHGYHVFVTPLVTVKGPQAWSGAIRLASYQQEQAWFSNYWQTLKPYAMAAEQAGAAQLSLGTEYEWLQTYVPDALWNGLISHARSVFSGVLTYDMNWTTLQVPPRAWMRNPNLKMIGVSAYLPLANTRDRVDPQVMPELWREKAKTALDAFATLLGKPIFLSEVGYRNSVDALYHSWESTSTAPADPAEQAAACDAVLTNILDDPHILGSFFWGWDDVGAFGLKGQPTVTILRNRYTAL